MSPPYLAGGPHHRFSWKRPGAMALAVTAAVIAGVVALLMAWPARGLAPVADVARVGAGHGHTCLVTTGGAVKCWGTNGHGELGDGTTTASSAPVEVQGLASGMASVSAGNQFTCALTTGGGVKCWGWGVDGRLGDNTGVERHAPVDVAGLSSGVTAVSLGDAHACALTSGGGVKCWGNNAYGQVGDDTNALRHAPVDVTGLASGVTAIATGEYHTCALLATGGVKCWGWNLHGQLGDNSTTSRKVPTDVHDLASGMGSVAAGRRHSCGRTTAGDVKCWGFNIYGELGDGTKTQRNTPVDTLGLGGTVTAVAAGGYHTCAISPAGGVKCWGGNLSGEAGNGFWGQTLTAPVDTLGLAGGVTRLAAGESHTCAVLGTGALKCWGRGLEGELGDGSVMDNVAPVAVQGLASGVGTLSVGGNAACVVTGGGGLKCWPVLADPTGRPIPNPVDVPGLASGVQGVSVGTASLHACALTSGGGVKCWGRNDEGQLGDGTTVGKPTPVDVSGLASGVSAVSAGALHTCARLTTGGMKCWGYNGSGQLGDGSYTQRTSPVDVSGLTSGVAAIAAGYNHTCARLATGGVRCWGENLFGQLGEYSSGMTVNVPLDVHGLSGGATAVAAGMMHSCALMGGGAIKCWGANSGQLGNGTTDSSVWPVDVSIVTDAIAITAGGDHTCSLNSSNGVRCWGRNVDGELGDGTLVDRLVPTRVGSLPEGAMQVGAGTSHTCVVTVPGSVKCWGANDTGQMGDGTSGLRPYPGDVMTADATPDAFGFASQTGVPLDSVRTSESVLPTGFDGTVAVTVANGLYAVGCTPPFVTTAGTLAAGQTVCVRHTAAPTPGTSVTTTLTLGGVPGTFTSTTGAAATLVVLAGPTESSAGESVTFTATVTGYSPTGSVAFRDGAAAIGGCEAVALAASQAQCTTSTLAVGVHPVGADYGGDAMNLPSSSNPVIHTVSGCDVGAPGDCDGDGIPNAVEIAEGHDPLAKDNDIFTVNRLFAMQQYRDFLGREGDAGGISFYTDLLASGAAVRANVIESFFSSPEFAGTVSPIVRLYFATFVRIPDYGGLQYQVNAYRTGTALTVIANNFAASPEFEFRYGTLTDSQYVIRLYSNVLGRTPVQAEVDYHVARLASGVTRGEVMAGFSESPEFQGGTFNDVYVTMMYVGMLGRAPEQGGFDYWNAYMDAGNPGINLILGFLNAPEYHNRFLP